MSDLQVIGPNRLVELDDVADAPAPSDGDALVFRAATNDWAPGQVAGGGTLALGDLTDVNIGDQSDRMPLFWSEDEQAWISDGFYLNYLAQVDLGETPEGDQSPGDVITYDGDTGTWVARAPSGGGMENPWNATGPSAEINVVASDPDAGKGASIRVETTDPGISFSGQDGNHSFSFVETPHAFEMYSARYVDGFGAQRARIFGQATPGNEHLDLTSEAIVGEALQLASLSLNAATPSATVAAGSTSLVVSGDAVDVQGGGLSVDPPGESAYGFGESQFYLGATVSPGQSVSIAGMNNGGPEVNVSASDQSTGLGERYARFFFHAQEQQIISLMLGNNETGDFASLSLDSVAGMRLTAPAFGWNTSPVEQPTVTGSRSDGSALASLLTALATMGFIVDETTA